MARCEPVGLVAGSGVLPQELARRMAADQPVVVAALRGQADPADFGCARAVEVFSPLAPGRIIGFFTRHGVRRCAFAGGVRRSAVRSLNPDLLGAALLPAALWWGDDRFLRSVAHVFDWSGVAVADYRPWVGDWVAGVGRIAGPEPAEDVDAVVGRVAVRAARFRARDRGQAVLWRKGRIAATEGRRGTDALLRRARPGDVLCKFPKAGQDMRFDVPAVGPDTVRAAARAGVRTIAVAAGGCLVLQPDLVRRVADELGVSVWGSGDFEDAS